MPKKKQAFSDYLKRRGAECQSLTYDTLSKKHVAVLIIREELVIPKSVAVGPEDEDRWSGKNERKHLLLPFHSAGEPVEQSQDKTSVGPGSSEATEAPGT